MPQPERFDVLVLGSGTGGKLIAWHMARFCQRTAVVERQWTGGSCPNVACMPSKNEIRSAEVAYLARHAAEFGTMTNSVVVDMATVRRRKREMVERQVAKHLENYQASGAQIIMGSGRFVAPKVLEVSAYGAGTRILTADKIFLNVGTHAAIPRTPSLAEAVPLTARLFALASDRDRGRLRGSRMSQAYRRFGSNVTIIESGPQLMDREDIDVSQGIVRDNLSGGNRSTRDRLIPYCMFTDPPLVHVGLSEGDAERQGIIVRVARLPVDSVLRAQATGERQGFMKVLVGENDDRILGFTMIGAAVGEVMAVVQMAMLAGASYGRLPDAILAHPTMAEGLGMLFSNVPRRSLQQPTPERAA
jgi:pyruvate/2-oxoglutarate dehydrogenase complex dihydrolipoamide dehydrogenase (E3) component